MATITTLPTRDTVHLGPSHRLARFGMFRELGQPRQMFEMLTPNWFASVMGTGIVAVAAARLPLQFPGLHDAAVLIWAAAGITLSALIVATLIHWWLYPANARSHLSNPVMAHFYGAPAMAMLTVGAATLLVGRTVLGTGVASDIDWVLWFSGTLIGLVTAVGVPYLTFTRHRVEPDSAFGGWLMPIVPPMVSASTGALLIPYAPAGQARLDLLLCCYAMFGLSLIASFVVITLIWQRLAVYKPGEARMVPTVWIVLGPLGQSITAATLLGANAHLAIPLSSATILKVIGVAYGAPVWGFALLWTAIATAITLRTARQELPFSLTWWSFTFPVGTCVTGTTGLALATGSDLLRVAATVWFGALASAWLVVAIRTVRGSLSGSLFLPAPMAGLIKDPLAEGAIASRP